MKTAAGRLTWGVGGRGAVRRVLAAVLASIAFAVGVATAQSASRVGTTSVSRLVAQNGLTGAGPVSLCAGDPTLLLAIDNPPGDLSLWRLGQPARALKLAQWEAGAVQAEISRLGSFVASLDADGSICLWNTDGSARPSKFARAAPDARCLAISPDERRIATGGADGRIRLWTNDGDFLLCKHSVNPSSA